MAQAHTDEPLDTRTLFKAYEAVAMFGGIACVAWGPRFFPLALADYPLGSGFVPRTVGFAMMGLAGLAQASRLVEGLDAKKQVLTLWTAAHSILLVGLLFQALVIMREVGPGTRLALGLLVAGVLLFSYARMTVEGMPWGALQTDHQTLFGDPREAGGSTIELRSAYEEQIRAAAAQEERNRLARDLHDSIKQQLFVIQTAGATAQARFRSDDAGALQAIEQVRSSAREAMTEMEVMLDQLRASPLENAGLVEALKKQCEALRFRTGADVRITVSQLPPNDSLRPGAHDAVFRIAQEALANVARHARATQVTVSLGTQGDEFELLVEDNGAGFERTGQAGNSGMGLGNMRARAHGIGGKVAIASTPGQGTHVRFSVPLVQAAAESRTAYRSLLFYWGAPLLLWIFLSAWDIISPERRFALTYAVPMTIIHAWLLGRVVRSYLHARQPERSKKAGAQ